MPKPYSLDLRTCGAICRDWPLTACGGGTFWGVGFVRRDPDEELSKDREVDKASGGRRHSKHDPYRAFLLGRVTARDDITMPELAAELAAAAGVQVAPASNSRWLIRNGYRFKKNAAGQRARSSRHQQGAAGMAGQASAADTA